MEFPEKFVCEDLAYSTYEKNVPAPLFRKSFQVPGEVTAASILICGLGFYDLFVNGQKITKGYLAPYISNTDHYTYFDQYDIRPYLTPGENVIGVMLGDGFLVGKTYHWDFWNNVINAAPMLALNAEVVCANGESLSFGAETFTCKKGPLIFNDLRSGVFYDARLEERGWNCPGFAENGWHTPLTANRPRGRAKLCQAEPIRVYREVRPVSITRGELAPFQEHEGYKTLQPFAPGPENTGGYIYDFGENNAGIYRLKIRGIRGQRVDIQCAEQLSDGKLDYNSVFSCPAGFAQRDLYTLSGEGEEVFEPMFTYHGFRYLYVSGITREQAAEDLLTYLVMSSDLEDRGSFSCSDETANAIFRMTMRSDRSNFFYFPTDCPQREKQGWTGDAAMSAEHMILTRGTENSWREWLHNIRASQREDGMLPGIVPTDHWGYDWGNGPAWDSVLFNLPYFAWKYRGDTEVIRENAAAMLRYLEYISRKRDEKGIAAIGLGDWVPVGKQSDDYDAELGFTDSVMVLDMCRKAARMFGAVGLDLHRAFADQLGKEMLASIRREYIDWDTYVVRKACQTSQAMAIFYDVFAEEEKPRAFDVLLNIIHRDGDSITSGFLGLRVIFHVLSQFGEGNLAWKMITKKEYPSYGHWAACGETTLLETFQPDGKPYAYSKNHHFLGDVANWFISKVGGIQVVNDHTVRVAPAFIEGLDWCRATHTLPAGEVEVAWERNAGGISLRVKAPKAVQCDVASGRIADCHVEIILI